MPRGGGSRPPRAPRSALRVPRLREVCARRLRGGRLRCTRRLVATRVPDMQTPVRRSCCSPPCRIRPRGAPPPPQRRWCCDRGRPPQLGNRVRPRGRRGQGERVAAGGVEAAGAGAWSRPRQRGSHIGQPRERLQQARRRQDAAGAPGACSEHQRAGARSRSPRGRHDPRELGQRLRRARRARQAARPAGESSPDPGAGVWSQPPLGGTDVGEPRDRLRCLEAVGQAKRPFGEGLAHQRAGVRSRPPRGCHDPRQFGLQLRTPRPRR
mmetsp:Transcript_87324/g.219790  ORF Transcript_87324/g.219790 Transcript_87324/m.219790 type:complete len:267 (+) Transcript_87324:295-1095(+)